MTIIKPFAFILMPFDSSFNDIYRLGIKDVCTKLDVVAERVDEQFYSESMLERIYRQIDAADIIIADMSGRNPNVFYEVGYAHAKGKLCTLLTQEADDIPFDLKHHRHLVYGNSIETLRSMLELDVRWLKSEIEKRKTQVFMVSAKAENSLLEKTDWSADGKFDLEIDIRNSSDRRSPEIDAVYLETTKHWIFSQRGQECPFTASETKESLRRHLLQCPIQRLGAGAWVPIKAEGRRRFWSKIRWKKRGEGYL